MCLHVTCLHGMGGEHIYLMFNELYLMTIINGFHQTLMTSMTLITKVNHTLFCNYATLTTRCSKCRNPTLG